MGLLLVGALAAVAVYSTASSTAYPWALLPALAVCGLGLGLYTVPFFRTALGRVSAQETGSAAGLLNAVQQLGGTLGVAVLGTVFLRAPAAMTGARDALWVAVGLVLVTGVATACLVRPAGPEGRSEP